MAIKKLKETIDKLKENRSALEDSSMKDIIEASTNFNVISYSDGYKPILKEIALLGKKIVARYRASPITKTVYQQYKGKPVNAFRNNEVGDYCEVLIGQTFASSKKQFKEIVNISTLG